MPFTYTKSNYVIVITVITNQKQLNDTNNYYRLFNFCLLFQALLKTSQRLLRFRFSTVVDCFLLHEFVLQILLYQLSRILSSLEYHQHYRMLPNFVEKRRKSLSSLPSLSKSYIGKREIQYHFFLSRKSRWLFL